MTKQERLFQAIGGADPELVARSDRAPARASSWIRWAAAAAACLAVLLAAGLFRGYSPDLSAGASTSTATISASEAGEASNGPPFDPAFSGETPSSLDGEALHLVWLRAEGEAETEAPEFMIAVNHELYTVTEADGVFTAAPILEQPENTPPCLMTIVHREGLSPAQAAEEMEAELSQAYASVSAAEPAQSPEGLYLSASSGTTWDDAQAEVWLADDHQGGTFILTSTYFTEAAEGHGARFRDMIATFQPVTEAVPGWLTELRSTAEAVSRAIFADDLSPAAELLTENAQVEGFGRDVLAEVSIASIDCAVDDPQSPETASVSIRFGFLEDSYQTLTLQLLLQEGRWLAAYGSMEK